MSECVACIYTAAIHFTFAISAALCDYVLRDSN